MELVEITLRDLEREQCYLGALELDYPKLYKEESLNEWLLNKYGNGQSG
jgi:hypothetical protein